MAKIGEILVEKGLVSAEQLKEAFRESKRSGELIGKTLVRMRLITEEVLLEVLAEQLGLTFYPSLKDIVVPDNVIKVVPPRFVWHYKFMPLSIRGKVLTIAVSDPLAVWPMEDLRLHLDYDVERILATEEEILLAIRRYYGVGAETVEEILLQDKGVQKAPERTEVTEVEDLEKSAQAASVIKLVDQILYEAVSSRATDIHIEPFRNKVRVRYRIDGILYPMHLPEEIRYLHQAIVSRIKILSNLNVVEKRLPQDGRAIVKIYNKQIDLRISIIPSLYGESVVIRILPVNLLFDLGDLGFLPAGLKAIDKLLKNPHGIIFFTGPTGSGKTTALYACQI